MYTNVYILGSAWNGQAAGSREAVQPALHTWLVVCGDEPVFPCDRLNAADSLGTERMGREFQAPEESLGLSLGEISARPCAVVCPPLQSVAVRAPFGHRLSPFWDSQKMRWAHELRYWDPEDWLQASSASESITATT